MSDIPQMIRLERQDTCMDLTYSEGSKFSVTYDDVRYFCPCAKCAPLRNEDDTAKSLRREVESMVAEKPKIERKKSKKERKEKVPP